MRSEIQMFRQGNDTVFWGDAIGVLETHIPDASVDLIFADPPYNIGKKFSGFIDRWPSDAEYVEWCKRWLDLCIRKLSNSGSLYLMASTQCMPHLDIYLRERLSVLGRIAWHYDSSGVQARKYYGSVYEPILYCVKDVQHYTFNSDEVAIEARTGAQRKLIDYRKPKPAIYNSKKVPGNVWYFARPLPHERVRAPSKPKAGVVAGARRKSQQQTGGHCARSVFRHVHYFCRSPSSWKNHDRH